MDWHKLPLLRNDKLIFIDTTGYALPGTIVPCLLCTKPFLMRRYQGAPDQICGECMKTYAECAVVRCGKCPHKPVICRLKPGVLDNGFTIQPNAVLHSAACNICQPGLQESSIIEVDAWERAVRPHKPVVIVPGFHKSR
jgi:hypothetical protein